MISIKAAFRSVVRRPQQNIAVILGITLGVSLFVGVQVGSDSLGAGLNELTIHSIGQRDASINPTLTPFILTSDILNQSLGVPGDYIPLIDSLQNTNSYNTYIKAMTERLSLTSTILQPESGSIEVDQDLRGIDVNQDPSFGKLINLEGKDISITSLGIDEVYIGKEVATSLLGDEVDPIGMNLTIQTTLLSQNQPLLNATSLPIPLTLNVKVKDVFADEGLGGESFSNFIIMPLEELQNKVFIAYTAAAALYAPLPVLGYGPNPISSIYISWKDNVEIGDGSAKAVEELQKDIETIVGVAFKDLISISDTRARLKTQIEFATDSLELLLNAFGYIIILAGVLIIINIQNMALQSREKETGILRAVGAKRKQIIMLNLLEAVFLGIIGSVVGIAGGYLYGKLLIIFLSIAFDFPASFFPTVLELDTIIISFSAGFFLSLLTGLIPAFNASRINIARVLRGIEAPPKEKFGKKTLYWGIILTVVAFFTIISLDPNPIIDGNNAFKNMADVEQSYLPIILMISGPSLLVAYFKNFRLGLSTVGLTLLGYAYFNIFYVMDQIEITSASSGDTNGLLYIVYLAGSLLIGSVITMAVNLGALAGAGQRITSWIARSRITPIRGTTMVAFRKMRSKVTRSTLTFALFATILTLNIWIGTFSYSFRYGLDNQLITLTGGSDIILYSPDNVFPNNLDFPQKLLDEFSNTAEQVQTTDVRGFMISPTSTFFTDPLNPLSMGGYKAISLTNDSFWESSSQENWIFRFDLDDNKTGTPFEYVIDDELLSVTEEDNDVWKAIANNMTVEKNGKELPLLATTSIFSIDRETGSFDMGPVQGESVWLNTTTGGLQEFMIASVMQGSPLSDFHSTGVGSGGIGGLGGFSPTMFVSEYWKSRLLAFVGYDKSENTFMLRTNQPADSALLEPFVLEMEQWANAGDFKDEYGLYGLIGVTTYSVYESQLEGGFQFFQFLQSFVSLGFAVGILGLLVVASRSVAERKREIGMLRAIGFRRRDIVVSVVLELIVLGMIGFFLGLANGIVMGYSLTNVFGGVVQFKIPWNTVVTYGLVTLFSAIFAAIIPAIAASNIEASESLRYTG